MQRLSLVRVPARIRELRHVEQAGRIGLGGVAHPDPNDVVPFLDGIGRDVGVGRDPVLARNAHASTGPVEGHAVIAALYRVA